MAVKFGTAWPVEATNAAWQKKKSFLDKNKAATKTGLGAELVKAEAAWKKINFDVLDVLTAPGKLGNPAKFKTPVDFDNAKAKATTQMTTNVHPASQAILVAAAAATKTKNNAALSNTAKTAAGVIETKLLAQGRLLRDLKLDDFDTRKAAKIQEAQLVASKFAASMKSALAKADIFIAAVKKTPTVDVFNKGIQTACRDLTQNLANVKNLADMGAPIGKTTPTALLNAIEDWAQDRDKLPAKATKEQVLLALKKYEDAVTGIKHWNA